MVPGTREDGKAELLDMLTSFADMPGSGFYRHPSYNEPLDQSTLDPHVPGSCWGKQQQYVQWIDKVGKLLENLPIS